MLHLFVVQMPFFC